MAKLEDLMNEIDAINNQAWKMAISVHSDPSMRTSIKNKAKELSDRLHVLASELEQEGQGHYATRSDMISELILDLSYAIEDVPFVSLRLGHEIESDKLKEQYAAIDAIVDIGKPAVEPLIQALQEKNTDFEWKQAADALGKTADSKAARPLIHGLEEKNDAVRKWAAQTLGKIGDAGAIAPLIQALKDKNRDVGWGASEALGKLGESAVEPLIHALKDQDHSVRNAAALSLGDIGNPKAVDPLIQALKDTVWGVRVQSAQALGKIADVRAITPLVQALKDEHQTVRHFVVEALSEIGEPAIAPLTMALNDENEAFRQLVKEALESIRVKLTFKLSS